MVTIRAIKEKGQTYLNVDDLLDYLDWVHQAYPTNIIVNLKNWIISSLYEREE